MGELDEFAAELLAAAPDLTDVLLAKGESLEPDPEMPTIWFGAAGRAVADRFDDLDAAGRSAVFGIVERHLAGGSELLQTCVATGLLEALASAVSGDRLDGTALAPLLGPRSRAHLDAWDAFTLGRSSLDGAATDAARPPAPGRSPRRWRRR